MLIEKRIQARLMNSKIIYGAAHIGKLEKVCNFSREENIYRNKEGELFICSERMKERIDTIINNKL